MNEWQPYVLLTASVWLFAALTRMTLKYTLRPRLARRYATERREVREQVERMREMELQIPFVDHVAAFKATYFGGAS